LGKAMLAPEKDWACKTHTPTHFPPAGDEILLRRTRPDTDPDTDPGFVFPITNNL